MTSTMEKYLIVFFPFLVRPRGVSRPAETRLVKNNRHCTPAGLVVGERSLRAVADAR